MSEFKVDLNFSTEVLKGASEAEDEVARILDEVKNEFLSGEGGAVDLTSSGLALKDA